ncbi:3,4-dehydroadipyl-CoA semialdehyde dehydrogenase [Engelhardtia mirabilis]|uniref:3,4-dehydroadipyl-CoA semialdehyde dehydrogenase n=1 Tax=Engelhardtia mirabilis TaxID=2528011 RepID=A0A518BI01_9BACT|nr:3,4-dehydroadipyl-CoA semialdehyde dehydrogenase [Planctomycetes bacterium Pla133]QDV00928.1 3,4-dehydroadipyl-CoA semialdehyde dehydrogenase [Planctomycetes bacterium Pla86]
MIKLESYLSGTWQTGQGDPQVLVDPATEMPLAECASDGIDRGAAVAYAREVGGPALRAMTFAERAAALKALSGAIHEHREALIELSIQNAGSTRGDAKFDLDGATGTLAAYASFGKRLGDRPFLTDGEGQQLGRTPRFWGEHVLVPRPGVAVHINAFNFPGWGMAEKMACSLLAGMPVIEKPGTPTALIAYRIAQIVVESGVLPEGAFQFLAGSAGDLLDHLGPMDVVAFTGGSKTAALIRGHENLVRHNVRVNIEADSLNSSVLGPDVDTDSELYGEFLANVMLDMTQKAGQKCTAVRRILVPKDMVESVVADLTADLERQKQGSPGDKDTRVGTLTSSGQLRDVRAGIESLAENGHVRCGGADSVGDAGYGIRPTLIEAIDADADTFHELEVFGPVASVLPYTGEASEAVRLVNRGGGGLVAAVYSDDADWTTEVTLGIAPWHGRVWIGSSRVKGQSTPPGLVLPQSVHGGPGRAGGGEELGALRGLSLYMQRTAVQGFQGLVQKRFGAPTADSED